MPMNARLLRPLSTFSPKTLPGLELWLDFGDSSTLTLSGSSISEARDKSGKGYAAVQATGANQPTLTTNAINGRSVASFNGSSSKLTISSFAAIGEYTAFAVCYRGWSVSAYKMIAATNSYSGVGTAGVGVFLLAGGTVFDWQTGDMMIFGDGYGNGRAPRSIGPIGSLANNTPVILAGKLSDAASGLWRNGTSIGTRVNTTGTPSSASGTFHIGGSPSSDFWDGAIAEFMLFKAALSSSQIKAMEKWLGRRYGITVA